MRLAGGLSHRALRRAWPLFVSAIISSGLLLTGPSPSALARITRTGVLHAAVADDFADEEVSTSYRLHTAEGSIPVLPTQISPLGSGGSVRVTGRMEHGYLVGSVQPLTRTFTPEPSGPLTVAVVRIAGPEVQEQPAPEAELRELVFTGPKSANAFYRQESYGKISLTGIEREDGDVLGPYTVASTSGTCGSWRKEADTEAHEQGVDLERYDYVLYVTAYDSGCRWAGLAVPIEAVAYINGGIPGSSAAGTIAHELGHDFGLNHALSLICEDENGYVVALSDKCTIHEYGDDYDVMGNGYVLSHAWYRNMMGFLPHSDIAEVTSSGIYTLHADYNETAETTVLRIPRRSVKLGPTLTDPHGEPIEWYDVEIRQVEGPFETSFGGVASGVLIRVEPPTAEGSYLLDANPGQGIQAEWALVEGEWALQPGMTFTDGSLRLKTLSAGEGTATVEVDLPEPEPTPDITPPGPPGQPETRISGAGIKLSWQESTSEGDLDHYVVYRDGSMIGVTAAPFYEDALVPPGPHVYVVYAEDLSHNRSQASPAAMVNMPDVTPPSSPGQPVAVAESNGVTLSWSASQDDVGVVGYVIFRDGTEVGGSATTEYFDGDVSAGTHIYRVYAEDRSGNRSAGLPEVTVTVPSAGQSLQKTQSPQEASGQGEQKEAAAPPNLHVRISLRHRLRKGLLVSVRALGEAPVQRLELWIDGVRRAVAHGPRLRYVWGAVHRESTHRLLAKAITWNGGVITSEKDLAASR
jgi:hypothetical protein